MKAYVALERELQSSGRLKGAALQESIDFCNNVENAPAEDIAAYDFFFQHLPEDETDLLSLVLRVQLLLEHRTIEFVRERLLTPDALDAARLSAHQLICLAESLTLDNDQSRWVWQMARRLNTLRNALAHNLSPKDIETKLASFAADYSKHYGIRESFINCAGHLYAQISALASVAREPRFRVRGRKPSQRP